MTSTGRQKKHLTTLEKILPWFDKRHYGFSSLMFFIGLLLLILYLSKPTAKSEDDLLQIKGRLADYSFKEKQGGRGTLYLYYIWLENYSNAFQIKAGFVDYFRRFTFENKISPKEMLYFTIPKDRRNRLNNSKSEIFVMSIDSDQENFLDKKTTLRSEKYDYDLYGAISLISIGIIWYFYRHTKSR